MKHDLTTGTWQDDTGCPISIILVATSDGGYLVSAETRQSLYEAAMATAAFVTLPVSNLNLISIALSNGGLLLLMKLE